MKEESSLDKCLKNDNCSFNKDFKSEINKRLLLSTSVLFTSNNSIKFLKLDGNHFSSLSMSIIFSISSPNTFCYFLMRFLIFFLIFFTLSFSNFSLGINCFSNTEIPVSLFTSIIKGLRPNNSQNNLIKCVFPEAVIP